jgi:hypothetical protein
VWTTGARLKKSMAAMRRSLSSCLDETRMWRGTERASLEKKPSTSNVTRHITHLMLRPQKCGVLNGWAWYFGSCCDRDSTLPKLCRHKTVGAPSAAMLPSRWGKGVSGPDPAARRMFVTRSNLSDIHLGRWTFLDQSSEVHGCVALEPVSTVIVVCTL